MMNPGNKKRLTFFSGLSKASLFLVFGWSFSIFFFTGFVFFMLHSGISFLNNLTLAFFCFAAAYTCFFIPVISWQARNLRALTLISEKLKYQVEEDSHLRTALFSIHEDAVKAQKEAEAAKMAVSHLAAIVASSQDAIIRKTLDGIITHWNKSAERLYGFTAEEMIGQSISKIVPSTHLEEFKTMMDKLRRGIPIENLETLRKHKDGSLFYVSISVSPVFDEDTGEIVGGATIARDVTAQHREQNKFRSAVEAAPSAMIMFNKEGNIVLVNQRTETFFGYSRSELENQSINILFPNEFQLRTEVPELFSFQFEKKMAAEKNLLAVNRDGKQFPVEISFNPLITEEGPFALVSIVDITQRKQNEKDLQEASERLAHFNRELQKSAISLREANEKLKQLDSLKSTFLMIASHELKTPLTSIKGYLSLVLSGQAGPLNERQKEFLTHLMHATERLHRLVIDLLNLSKIESGQMSFNPEPVEMEDLLRKEIFTFQAMAKNKSIDLQLKIENDLATVSCDKDKMSEIIENMVSNAIKYTPVKGRVEVRAKRLAEQLQLEVEDTGIGIPLEKQDRIFEPFQRFHKKDSATNEDSTGLGLSLTKKLIEMHEGSITLKSETGKGTIFTLLIPLNH